MLRVGIIGCGSNGYGHFINLRQNPQVEITALADAVPEQAQKWVAELDETERAPSVVTDLSQIWEKVDAVWICTPPGMHGEQTLAALEAGKHVLCEKPLSLDLAQGDRIVRLAQDKNLKLLVGYCLRFQPYFARFKDVAHDGTIGDLVSVWCIRASNRTAKVGSWRDDIAMSGGMLIETFTHNIDWMRHVAGEIEEVYAVEHTLNPGYNFEDHAFGIIRFAGGATGEFKSSWSSPFGNYSWGITGTRGQAINGERGTIRLAYLDGTENVLDVGTTRQTEVEDHHFVEAVLNDAPLLFDSADSLKTLEAHLALKLSGREGRPVCLPLKDRNLRLADFARGRRVRG